MVTIRELTRGPGRRWASHRLVEPHANGRGTGDAVANGRDPLQRHRQRFSRCWRARDLAAHQPHRRYPPDPRPPRHVPSPRSAPGHGRQPADEATTTAGRRAPPCASAPPEDGISHEVDENERGLKDTVRVNPNEVVEIAVRFAGLRRPLHVPLPHPRARRPRHDATFRRHARRADAIHVAAPSTRCRRPSAPPAASGYLSWTPSTRSGSRSFNPRRRTSVTVRGRPRCRA